jgi:hypothetical protein
MRRVGLAAGAVVCLVLATFVVLLAADVWRWRDALRSDDGRYRSAPSSSDLWDPASFFPLALARNSLGIDDDLAFRRAVRAMRLGKLEDTQAFDTEVLLQRADAQTRLAAIAESERDPERRSRAMTLLGVLLLATPAQTVDEQKAALRAAITNLQTAIELDPDNSDAKFNLEFALRQRSAGLAAQGGSSPNPLGNPNRSRGAATGAPGSGY